MACEKYGFVFPLYPTLHPNGVHAGKEAKEVDKIIRRMCHDYYVKNIGTEEEFRNEFFYVS